MVSLSIPKKFRMTGLHVYCNECKSYSRKKDGFLKKSPKCTHPPEKQVYKIMVHVRGTRNGVKVFTIKTRDINEVAKKGVEFITLLKSNNYNIKTEPVKSEKSDPNRWLLLHQMDKFLLYKENGGRYAHEAVQKREKSTVNDYKRNFRYFLQSIEGDVKIEKLRVDEIDGSLVEKFHFFIERKSKEPKTYNNIVGSLRALYNHLITYEKLAIENPFNAVTLKPTSPSTTTFTKEELEKILRVTTRENGYDNVERRNWFREWLPMAFKLGAFSCLRLGELVYLKYSDIREIDGILILEAENQKVNKLFGEKETRKKRIKRIRVINELIQVLTKECNYQQNKGSNQYIIAPDKKRGTVKDIIGKGFTHFRRVAKVNEDKCFKNLRTSFISRIQMQYGDINFTRTVSDHSNESVVRKHYIPQIETAKKMGDFYVFTPPDELNND